ncbi:MAG: hypothetical protein IJ539_05375 [Prevotella sp.]|nr:hypothetical protein [Prevotella sp.]
MDDVLRKKMDELRQYAVEHITRKGLHTGRRWLEDSFNEYYSAMATPGVKVSQESEIGHRQLLAQRVSIECIRELTPEQLKQLDAVLNDIAKNPSQSRGLKM